MGDRYGFILDWLEESQNETLRLARDASNSTEAKELSSECMNFLYAHQAITTLQSEVNLAQTMLNYCYTEIDRLKTPVSNKQP